jgi:hypothetical protein
MASEALEDYHALKALRNAKRDPKNQRAALRADRAGTRAPLRRFNDWFVGGQE